ncbi:MAG: DUF3108 domain-containing protein [Ignavibacteria bacterium]|nr:DUF3108 domain-containing protein [Ignavibacteria bacterium]
MKYKSLIFSVQLVLFTGWTFSQISVFQDGEELFYEVYYSFVNIGWSKFYTERVTGKSNFFKTYAKLKSNESIPFVDVNYEFISEIEVSGNQIKPHRFISYEFKDKKKSTLECIFKYDSGYVKVSKTGFDGKEEINKIIYVNKIYQDGLSILYYARFFSLNDASEYIPVLMHDDTARMLIKADTKKRRVSINDYKNDISSVFIEGFAYFTAVYGLTGEFSGWFSNDEARVPLKAKLEVKIGTVTLELKSWKRKNWNPPDY